MLAKVAACAAGPISAHSWYASVEASRRDRGHPVRLMYVEPQETTRMTGLLGTLSNNQSIDMSPADETDGVPNASSRAPKRDEYGLICAGHTAHSTEALKVRRVVDRAVVRVFGGDTLQSAVRGVTSEFRQRLYTYQRLLRGKLLECGKCVECSAAHTIYSALEAQTDTTGSRHPSARIARAARIVL